MNKRPKKDMQRVGNCIMNKIGNKDDERAWLRVKEYIESLEKPATHETVEQWEERTGMTLSDDAPVWINGTYGWGMNTYHRSKFFPDLARVVAEPHLGKPDDNWRPEHGQT